MQGGALKSRLRVFSAFSQRSAMGTQAPDWREVEQGVAAAREDVSDTQRDAADQRQASITVRFRVRWSATRALVDQLYQLEDDRGVRFQILATKEPVRGRWLEWSCKAAQGVRT